eukprot:TRINITY_DN10341_c0_g1_i10.p1 TRINITY_DN10341_c0_g1~~TRINITY_DN10341_c0_g1_i10.p1  ORF type:complete len:272 (-),score=32.34 TRINITY_DN10341_c0_g1_i10:581-1396(-)
MSSVILQPLDMVKTRQQLLPRLSMLQHSKYILRHEGILAFWKGLVPTLARTVPGVGVYFSSLRTLQSSCLGDIPPSPSQSLMLGCAARCTAGILLIPVTVIKTRFESGVYVYNGIYQALKTLLKTEGLRGLTSGLFPTLLRDVPYSGLYLMFYSQLKTSSNELINLKDDAENNTEPSRMNFAAETKWVRHFGCSIVAGVLASVVTHPFDVIKTKVQVSKSPLSSGKATKGILLHEGLGGFFVGLLPRLLRRTFMTALSWTLYERIFDYIIK